MTLEVSRKKGTTIQLVQLKLSLRMAPWRHFSGNLQRHFSSGPRTTRKNDAGGFQKNDARVPPYTTHDSREVFARVSHDSRETFVRASHYCETFARVSHDSRAIFVRASHDSRETLTTFMQILISFISRI